MKQIVLDYETYYSQEYSLRKMTPVEYILDPRFETIGCAVSEGGAPAFWLTHEELTDYLRELPDKVAVISHNALFDMCILAFRYGYVPTLMIDTLGMARAWLAHRMRSLSLDALVRELKLGIKGDTVYKVQGMRLADIKAAGYYDAYAEYSKGDANLTWKLYRWLVADGFPLHELQVMDVVLRCAVKPRFLLDQTLLAEHLHEVQQAKENLLERCGLASRDDLMSNDRFAAALEMLGVEPPRKISLTTGKETWAFAKTDQDFLALEEHDDPLVQALVSARIGVKSTIEETRTQKFISISNLVWPGNTQGKLPVPLRYSGAHTHRLSGDWGMNLQNLPSRGNNKLRSALIAPEGARVVAVDASQIEARLAAWFCGEEKLVNAFANKEDVYSSFASQVFGYQVNKKDHPPQRFAGKTGILSLQFGVGAPKFQNTLALQSKAQMGEEIALSDEEAANVVNTYRRTYSKIPAMWGTLGKLIPMMTRSHCEVEIGPVTFLHEKILLPSGLYLHYHNLENKDGEWWFTHAGKPKKIYGGKMLENIIQALARICTMDAAVRVKRRTGLNLNLQVHDELVYVVPTQIAKITARIVTEEMRVTPSWGTLGDMSIPLDAESGIGASYGET